MHLLPLAVASSFLGLVLVACGGATQSSTDGTASQAPTDRTPSQGSSSSSGGVTAAPSLSSQPVGAESATRFEVASNFCGSACTSCQGLSVRAIDLVAGTLDDHRCVPLDDKGAPLDGSTLPEVPPGATARFRSPCFTANSGRGDAITRTSLRPSQVAALRSALAGVRHATGTIEELDGQMWSLEVEGPQGKLEMSPSAACGPRTYDQVVAGFDALKSAVDAL